VLLVDRTEDSPGDFFDLPLLLFESGGDKGSILSDILESFVKAICSISKGFRFFDTLPSISVVSWGSCCVCIVDATDLSSASALTFLLLERVEYLCDDPVEWTDKLEELAFILEGVDLALAGVSCLRFEEDRVEIFIGLTFVGDGDFGGEYGSLVALIDLLFDGDDR